MSVTTVDRSKSLSSPVVYAVYGTRANAKAGRVRAAALTVVCGEEMKNDSGGRWAGLEFIESGREIMGRYGSRSNQAITLVQSWSRDELDGDNSTDVQKANAMGADLAQRLAPGTPYVIATHTDGKSRCVHNHIILLNHDLNTGKAAPRRTSNWHAVKAINDSVMRDWGMRTLQPKGFVKHRRAERLALRDGKSVDSTGLEIDELTGETWADFLRKRVDALVSDERVLTAPDGLQKACEIAAEYNLSLRSTDGDLSIGLIGDDGEEAVYTTRTPKGRSRRRKAADAGSKFGPGYTTNGLRDRIAEAQAQLAAALARQTRIERLKKLKESEEDSDQTSAYRTTTAGPGDVPRREPRPRPGSPGDYAGAAHEGLSEDGHRTQSDGRTGEQDFEHRGLGGGTEHIVRAAAEAQQAAEEARSDNGRHKGVRPNAESSRRNHQQPGQHADRYGSGYAEHSENTARSGEDVPSNNRSRETPSEAQRRKRHERLARLNQAVNGLPEFRY